MKKLGNIFIVLFLMLGLTTVMPASAHQHKIMEHGKSDVAHHGMGSKMSKKMDKHSSHGRGHLFGPHWKETLSEDQKMKADRMHLELKKSINLLKAKKTVKKAELNNLIVKDGVASKAINNKIDELLDVKREIMRIKYNHMVEMRNMLTPEQRVSFDMGLLERSGHKKGHRKH